MPTQQFGSAESDSIDVAGLQLDLHIEGLLRQAAALVDTINREQEDTLTSATASALRQHTHTLERAIEWLSSRIPPLTRRVQDIKALLSPIRCLPPELLSRIFLLAVPDVWYRAPSGGLALPFASVCSRWRAVALSMPQLWSSIIISPRKIWDESRHTTIQSRQKNSVLMRIAIAYIARSACAPLRIAYTTHAHNTYRLSQWQVIDDLPPQGVWERLLKQSARWISVDLSCLMDRFVSREEVSFPRLESLTFEAVEDSERGHNLISFFDDAPLRRLKIQGNILPRYWSVAWPSAWRLSHLHLTGTHTSCIIEALTAFAPHLEDVEVRNRGSSRTWSVSAPLATLPKLHKMEISGGTMPVMRFRAPALIRLVMSDGLWPPPAAGDDLHHLAAFLALDSHPSLTHLKLDEITGNTDGLLPLLPALATLTCLWVSNRSKSSGRDPHSDLINPSLVKHLTRVRSSPASLTLLPRLKALALYVRGRYSPEIKEPVVDMLRSRMNTMEYDGLELQPLLALRSDISNVTLYQASGVDDCE